MDTWTLRGQRSCPERVGTGEPGKAVYISLDGVMAERPLGAPGPRSSQPGSPQGSGPEVVGCPRSRQRRLGSPEDTMRAVCLMVTGLGASCCLQLPHLKAATCSSRPRLLEALLLELVNLPINAGPMCEFMRRKGGPDKALPRPLDASSALAAGPSPPWSQSPQEGREVGRCGENVGEGDRRPAQSPAASPSIPDPVLGVGTG